MHASCFFDIILISFFLILNYNLNHSLFYLSQASLNHMEIRIVLFGAIKCRCLIVSSVVINRFKFKLYSCPNGFLFLYHILYSSSVSMVYLGKLYTVRFPTFDRKNPSDGMIHGARACDSRLLPRPFYTTSTKYFSDNGSH